MMRSIPLRIALIVATLSGNAAVAADETTIIPAEANVVPAIRADVTVASAPQAREIQAPRLATTTTGDETNLPIGIDATTRSMFLGQYPDARIVWKDASLASHAPSGILTSTEVRPGILRVTFERPATPESLAQRVTEDWPFSALRTAWIAKRRIRPAEPLSREDFAMEEIDLTEPMIHEVRGLIVAPGLDLEKYETRVTILEGQFPITSGVQKIPAVKRGETVRLILWSGDLELSVPGVVQEPAQIGGTLRVLTTATKREVSGTLREGRIVEVRL